MRVRRVYARGGAVRSHAVSSRLRLWCFRWSSLCPFRWVHLLPVLVVHALPSARLLVRPFPDRPVPSIGSHLVVVPPESNRILMALHRPSSIVHRCITRSAPSNPRILRVPNHVVPSSRPRVAHSTQCPVPSSIPSTQSTAQLPNCSNSSVIPLIPFFQPAHRRVPRMTSVA